MVFTFPRRAFLGAGAIGALAACAGRAGLGSRAPRYLTLEVAGGRRSRVSVWRATRSRGTILFSHGALSAPAKYDALLGAWAAAGFDVWAPLHVDSTDHPETKAFPGLASWRARLEDMAALAAHVGARDMIAAGHSYGALVALTMGGAAAMRPQTYTGPMRDPRVRAVVAFSPPGPASGLVTVDGYAALATPALIQTGTADVPPGATDPLAWRAHLAAFEAVPERGDRFAVVLDGVDHYFGGIICRPDLPGPKQAGQFARALELTSLFLDGYGARQAAARRLLLGQRGRIGVGELLVR